MSVLILGFSNACLKCFSLDIIFKSHTTSRGR